MIRYLSHHVIQPSVELIRSPERFFRDKSKPAGVADAIIFVVIMGLAGSFIQMFFYFIDPKLSVGTGLARLSEMLNMKLLMPFRIIFHGDLALLIAAFIYPLLFMALNMLWSVIMHRFWKILGGKKCWSESFEALAYCSVIFPITVLLLAAANVYNFMTDFLYPSFFALSLLGYLYFQNIIATEIHDIPVRKVWISSLVLWPIIVSGVLYAIYNR